MPLVRLDGSRLRTWDGFHDAFASAFGFPGFYGRNTDAWTDCMSSHDDPAAGMTAVHGSASDPVVLRLDNADAMPTDIFAALVECAGFVNWRRLEAGEPAVLVLAFYR